MSIELKRAAQQAVDAFHAFGDADDFASLFELTKKMCALRTAIQQAGAQQSATGEPFGYIHHFAAHDESGALIDTTWEADGCADPLPHPTFPSMWKWAHCTPFYTTPQPAQATQAEVTEGVGDDNN